MFRWLRVLGTAAAMMLLFAGGVKADPYPHRDDKARQNKDLSQWTRSPNREIIVRFKKHKPQGDLQVQSPSQAKARLLNQTKCELLRSHKSRDDEVALLRVPHGKTMEEMLAVYADDPAVAYVEENGMMQAFLVPNDANYALQWNFHNPITGGINIQAAWDLQKGDPCVIVAVIDTGVAYENNGMYRLAPDLANTRFVPGFDFVNNDPNANDDNGHGTHVAGTVAQSTNNNYGVAGIAFNCSIMPIKVLDSSGNGYYFSVARGIEFAADHGAKVINLSLGGPGDSYDVRKAVEYAYEKGCVIVCAAGNGYINNNNIPNYPAAYDDCIAVGATRFDNTRAPYSNTGSYVDLVAPGGYLPRDGNGNPIQDPNGGLLKNAYGYVEGIFQQTLINGTQVFGIVPLDGTSMASPHVAAVAALLVSNGITSPDKVREALLKTARYIPDPAAGDKWSEWYGHGLLDAYAVLRYTFPVLYEGDLNEDYKIDSEDLMLLASQWLRPDANEVITAFLEKFGPYDPNDPNTWFDPNDYGAVFDPNIPSADISGPDREPDDCVDFYDFEILYKYWLIPQPVSITQVDLNRDGVINMKDYAILAVEFGNSGDRFGDNVGWDVNDLGAYADINRDGRVDVVDLVELSSYWLYRNSSP